MRGLDAFPEASAFINSYPAEQRDRVMLYAMVYGIRHIQSALFEPPPLSYLQRLAAPSSSTRAASAEHTTTATTTKSPPKSKKDVVQQKTTTAKRESVVKKRVASTGVRNKAVRAPQRHSKPSSEWRDLEYPLEHPTLTQRLRKEVDHRTPGDAPFAVQAEDTRWESPPRHRPDHSIRTSYSPARTHAGIAADEYGFAVDPNEAPGWKPKSGQDMLPVAGVPSRVEASPHLDEPWFTQPVAQPENGSVSQVRNRRPKTATTPTRAAGKASGLRERQTNRPSTAAGTTRHSNLKIPHHVHFDDVACSPQCVDHPHILSSESDGHPYRVGYDEVDLHHLESKGKGSRGGGLTVDTKSAGGKKSLSRQPTPHPRTGASGGASTSHGILKEHHHVHFDDVACSPKCSDHPHVLSVGPDGQAYHIGFDEVDLRHTGKRSNKPASTRPFTSHGARSKEGPRSSVVPSRPSTAAGTTRHSNLKIPHHVHFDDVACSPQCVDHPHILSSESDGHPYRVGYDEVDLHHLESKGKGSRGGGLTVDTKSAGGKKSLSRQPTPHPRTGASGGASTSHGILKEHHHVHFDGASSSVPKCNDHPHDVRTGPGEHEYHVGYDEIDVKHLLDRVRPTPTARAKSARTLANQRRAETASRAVTVRSSGEGRSRPTTARPGDHDGQTTASPIVPLDAVALKHAHDLDSSLNTTAVTSASTGPRLTPGGKHTDNYEEVEFSVDLGSTSAFPRGMLSAMTRGSEYADPNNGPRPRHAFESDDEIESDDDDESSSASELGNAIERAPEDRPYTQSPRNKVSHARPKTAPSQTGRANMSNRARHTYMSEDWMSQDWLTGQS